MKLGDPKRRLRAGLIALCFIFTLFGGRLLQLQGVDASTYAVAAQNERARSVELPAARGKILDTNEHLLATSVEAYDVTVDQRQVVNPGAYALDLAPILKVDSGTLLPRLTGSKGFAYVARKVTPAQRDKVARLKLPGIYFTKVPERVYPSGAVAGNIVGFLSSDGRPLGGLELSRNKALAGTDGHSTYEVDVYGQRIPLGNSTDVNPVPGQSLRLTIDSDLQWYAQQKLADKVVESAAESGSLVVYDAKTGKILALATYPSVDPNDPSKTKASDRGNRPVEEAYEPGSVEKPLTMAALLDSGAVKPDTVFTVPDRVRRSGHTIHDFDNHEVQRLTAAGVIARSSNVGMLLAAERLDKETMRDYLSDFGLGERLNLGLPGETAGILPKKWSDIQRDTISFGQGLAVNTVQLAAAYGALANDGVRMPPQLVEAVIDPDGEEHEVRQGAPRRVVSEQTAREVTLMMEAVVAKGGTAPHISVPGYRIAAKTGTAQRFDSSCNCYRGYTASFMGFAPAEDPSLVVAVSIQDPKQGRYGGQLGGPVFADVMSFALQKTAVPPSTTEPPKMRLYADK